MKKITQLVILSLITMLLFFACPSPDPADGTTAEYTITFDKNDDEAEGTMEPQVIAEGATENLTLCGFTKEGWAFTGWATTPGGTVEYTDGAEYTMGNADITLYAKWDNTMRTVIFDLQGGSAVPPQTVPVGSMVMEPDAPRLYAHALEGWFREPDCVSRWDFSSDAVTENITLYR